MSGSTVTNPADYFKQLSDTSLQIETALISAYADLLFDAWRRRSRVFIFGNGGSAFNASHHVADYVKTASCPNRHRLQAFSLTDNAGLTTAIGNDLSYEESFSFPLESYSQPGDIAVGISCSGNSPNLLHAFEWARQNDLKIVALTGFRGGKAKDLAHLHINVPSDNYGVIEDLHLSIGHIAAQMLFNRIATEQVTK
jgi:D-sedoheptulose 7-phosphate isomerase